jgi:hypothetical protein
MCSVLRHETLPPAPVTVRCASGYMLENPSIPHYSSRCLLEPVIGSTGARDSDNVTGAENQQERLIEFRGLVSGLVDGEGCFSIGLARHVRGDRGLRDRKEHPGTI